MEKLKFKGIKEHAQGHFVDSQYSSDLTPDLYDSTICIKGGTKKYLARI